jgi:hypothetical protein
MEAKLLKFVHKNNNNLLINYNNNNMQSIEFKKGIEIGLDELAQRLSQLDSIELNLFFSKLNEKIMGQPQFNNLSQETILLKKIKNVIPTSVLRQYRTLRLKALKKSIY